MAERPGAAAVGRRCMRRVAGPLSICGVPAEEGERPPQRHGQAAEQDQAQQHKGETRSRRVVTRARVHNATRARVWACLALVSATLVCPAAAQISSPTARRRLQAVGSNTTTTSTAAAGGSVSSSSSASAATTAATAGGIVATSTVLHSSTTLLPSATTTTAANAIATTTPLPSTSEQK